MRTLFVIFVTALVLFVLASITSQVLEGLPSSNKSRPEPSPFAAGKDTYGLPPKTAAPEPPARPAEPPAPEPKPASVTASIADSTPQPDAAALRLREAEVTTREEMLKLIQDDLRRDFVALNDLQNKIGQQVKQTLESTSLQLQYVSKQRDALTGREKTLSDRLTEVDRSELPNVKKIAEMYDRMEPELAAKIVSSLALGGDENSAAKILAHMKDRQAAKVLAAVSATDAGLAAKLTEKLRAMKLRPEDSAATEKKKWW